VEHVLTPARIALLQGGGPDDALFALPALQALRRAHPEAAIDCIASPAAAEVFRLCPEASRVLRLTGGDARHWRWARLLWLLRRSRYDLAIMPDGSLDALLAAYLASVPARAAAVQGLARLLATHPVPIEPHMHRIDTALRVVASAGVPTEGAALRLRVSPAAAQAAAAQARRWSSGLPLVALIPGSGPGAPLARSWPAERYALLARSLIERGGVRVVLMGDAADAPLLEAVQVDVPFALPAWPGLGDYEAALAALAECAMVVASDSVWLHLAVAAGARCTGIYGITSAVVRGPYGPSHLAIQAEALKGGRRRTGGGDDPVAAVTVQDILSALGPHFEELGLSEIPRSRGRPVR